MEAQVARRRFTVHEYHRMGEAGILHEDDRIELIEGELIEMAAIGARHFTTVNTLNYLLVTSVGEKAIVSIQNPVRLGEFHEPQPDATIIRNRNYRESLPTPEDALLLIEVSDTTLAYDKGVKLPLYAKAGIPEVWIVDLKAEEIERHTEPTDSGYRHIEKKRRGESIEATSIAGISIPVAAILGG